MHKKQVQLIILSLVIYLILLPKLGALMVTGAAGILVAFDTDQA